MRITGADTGPADDATPPHDGVTRVDFPAIARATDFAEATLRELAAVLARRESSRRRQEPRISERRLDHAQVFGPS